MTYLTSLCLSFLTCKTGVTSTERVKRDRVSYLASQLAHPLSNDASYFPYYVPGYTWILPKSASLTLFSYFSQPIRGSHSHPGFHVWPLMISKCVLPDQTSFQTSRVCSWGSCNSPPGLSPRLTLTSLKSVSTWQLTTPLKPSVQITSLLCLKSFDGFPVPFDHGCQPQHYRHLGPHNSWWWWWEGAVLCISGCVATSLVSPH